MARTKRKVNPVKSMAASAVGTSKQRIYQAGGYIRLSVEDSGRHGADTIKNQKEMVRGYIESQLDMELHELYCDNGQTGTDFERPEFERLMQDVKAGKVDCIVVKDLSRFGRNYRETGNYLERIFPFLDVRFVAVSDHFDTLSAEWSVPTVKKLLSSEVYVGHMVQGCKRESFYEGKKQQRLPESEWIIVHNTHEPIVDERDFQKVQKMAQEQKAAYQKNLGKYDSLGKTENILKGLDLKLPIDLHGAS